MCERREDGDGCVQAAATDMRYLHTQSNGPILAHMARRTRQRQVS